MAAQSHVAVSFKIPEYTTNADSLGTLRILEAIKKVDKKLNFYQVGSSEMFGKVVEIPQTEKTPFLSKKSVEQQKFTHTGLLLITESPIIFLHLMAFYLTTRAL